ncbi:MAG: CoA transferase, partial [Chloroflexi bacterium]|nr:CoA transferase [Chloroflexota bacterium]
MRKSWGSCYPNWDPGERPWNRYPIFQSHARNKKSITLDLYRPEGREVFYQLVAIADVFVENSVPETVEKMHATHEELVRYKPDLISLRMPAYGLSGPYSNFRSFGVQLEGTAGHTLLRGYPDMDPSTRDDVYIGDAAAGVNGAFAVAMALRHRRRTGQGQLIEMAQCENFVPYLGEAVMDYSMNRRVHDTVGNRHWAKAPQGVYRCKGIDRWVTLAVSNDSEWKALCVAMGNPSLAGDPRFANGLSRWKNHDELDRVLSAWTASLDQREAMERLQAAGVAAGMVMDEADLFVDPHMHEQDYFKQLTHADAGTHFYPGLMWTAANTPNEVRTPPCRMGEHNEYGLKDLLGLTQGQYTRLEETGHVGMDYASHLA